MPSGMKKPVEVKRCRTADEFLDSLHRRRGDWSANGPWFFRGHRDARWKLLPSAHRSKSWHAGLTLFRNDPTSDDVEFWERELILRFYGLLERAGLPIPREDELVALTLNRFNTDSPWPDPLLEPLLALAQHNGVPTRLLDWTLSWKVAAYFAAVDALRHGSKSLNVWAISGLFVRLWGDKLATNLTCRIVRTPRHGNPNLHAQAGSSHCAAEAYERIKAGSSRSTRS
jgi:hypothetical protein